MEKYERVGVIGEGSFGQVVKYVNKDKFYALKFMPKCQKDSELQALLNECEIQIKISHENIVKAYEYKESGNHLVLVTEFIDGGNLSKLMENHPNGLGENKVKKLAIDLLCALHYLHCRRVLHRDLKPQNVLIEKASGMAKLCDFGFARNLGNKTMVLTSLKGTPLYMAPEIVEEKPYDFKADLWSAGAILYEATFGKAPFATDSLLTLVNKIRNEKIFWPSKIADRPACTAFLQGLLEKDPKKRLIWSDIYEHVYLSNEPRIIACQKSGKEFTMAPTESQELAKEIQRQDKAKKITGWNFDKYCTEVRRNEKYSKDQQWPKIFGFISGSVSTSSTFDISTNSTYSSPGTSCAHKET